MSAVLPAISRLSHNVIRILGMNPGPFTLQGTNTYLIGSGDRRVLLDTGEPNKPEYVNLLKQVLQEHKCCIDTIVISHWHGDHVGGIPGIFSTLQLNQNTKVFKFQNVLKDNTDLVHYEYVQDGHELKTVDGLTLKFYETPGHTTDHMVVHLENDNSLFSGDCILGEGSTVFEDLITYMASLERIKRFNPSRIFPGHGPVIEHPMEKIDQYIQHRLEREQQILAAIPDTEQSAITIIQLVSCLYPDLQRNERLWWGAVGNVTKHLAKLFKENQIKMKGNWPANQSDFEHEDQAQFWK